MVRDPSTAKYKRARLFVLTLGYSRKCIRLLSWRSSAQIWAELHERAFRRLGGTIKIIVLDNLGEGVLTPDIYDPTLNPLYPCWIESFSVGSTSTVHRVSANASHGRCRPTRSLVNQAQSESQRE